MLFICYKNCSTCKKVEKLMEEKNLDFEKRDIKEDNPSAEEIEKWHKQTELPIKRFFNTSGKIYREKHLKDKLDDMTDEEKYDLLSEDGMLVKRPILITDEEEVYVGPDVKKYVESL